MEINWLVILIVSAIAFAAAPLWFGTLFGKLWMKIHGWENMSKKELKAQEEGMGKLLAIEAVNTVLMVSVLAFLVQNLNEYSPFLIGFLIWVGFYLTSSVSNVIWGADKKKWQSTKIALLAGFNLIVVILSTYLLSIWL